MMVRTNRLTLIDPPAALSQQTVARGYDAMAAMFVTMEATGSVVSHLSTMGMTIVKGA
jgi:hypothetical protein